MVLTDLLPEGWSYWRDWHKAVVPDNYVEIAAVESDRGRYLGYVRAIARRRPEAKIETPITSVSTLYVKAPLLRD